MVVLSLGFALVGGTVALGDSLFFQNATVNLGEPAPLTVRIPPFAGFRSEGVSLGHGGVLLERGEIGSEQTTRAAAEVLAARPAGVAGWATYAAGFFLLCAFFSSSLRTAHRGKLVRHQLVLLMLLGAAMLAVKVAVSLTSVAIIAIPAATLALLARGAVDRASAIAVGLFSAFAIGALVPFDPGVITVMVGQTVAPVLVLADTRLTKRSILIASVVSACAAVAAYFAYAFLVLGAPPALEITTLHRSGVVAAAIGGLASGPLAIALLPPFQVLLGEVTQARLVALEDFSNPLLQQIAERSPGTWQHSLAMANMAETAANAVGANGRLVRTGAYYHDLGKSLQPKYFIENLTRGEPSPHDSLAPEVSADAIFAHVTEGVRLGRARGLPERIIDFMHTHHGDGRLEYFWSKCQELGNPGGLTEADFRYPGLRPQSVETAVLAIVDAVEAASRTLRSADDKSIRKLVQRIVYGKLHLGQLDESGLTMSDLRKISESLVTTIKAAHHGRIEYPWQKEEAAEAAAAAASAGPASSPNPSNVPTRAMGAMPPNRDAGTITDDVHLDSLDAPRPAYRTSDRTASKAPNEPAEVSESSNEELALLETGLATEDHLDAPEPAVETAPMRPEAIAAAAEESLSGRLPQALIIDDSVPSAPIPRPLKDSIPIEAGDSSIIFEQIVETSTGPVPVGSVEATPGLADVLEASSSAEPAEPAERKPRPSSNTGRLAEWEQALEKALPSRPAAAIPAVGTPAPGDKNRAHRDTGALVKAHSENVLEPIEASSSIELSAESLAPGTLVVGAPPETHPRKSSRNEKSNEQTLEVRIPVPLESIPPEKRATAERRVTPPPAAFPDDTEPSVVALINRGSVSKNTLRKNSEKVAGANSAKADKKANTDRESGDERASKKDAAKKRT